MKFKKLTLAAAISIGLASVATVGAFADGNQDLACGCAPAAPVIVSPACPCEAPACGCQEAVPCCEPQPACPCQEVCPPCDKPVCGSAPNVCEKIQAGTQQYAYPAGVFGAGNNVIQADPFAIGLSPTDGVSVAKTQDSCNCGCGCAAPMATNCGCGVPVASGCGCSMPVLDTGCGTFQALTGAAIPVSANPCCTKGAVVDRDCNRLDGALCPIQIKTETSLPTLKKSFNPFQMPTTGCATPVAVSSVFCDVPEGYWANCDINKLVSKNVIAGYPDRTFRPTLPVSRAEFASLIANGLELCRCAETTCPAFCDVPGTHWANNTIQRSVAAGYLAGYPDNTFKPGIPVSRAEAITTIAKAFKCPDISDCDATQILSQYQDGCKVPSWAKLAVAKALKQGLLKDTSCPNMINPCLDASRADVASMLSQARVALCIDKPESTGCACNACDNQKTAYMENCETVDIPTLKVTMKDQISAANSDIGDHFAAQTIDPVVINGVTYPACSRVNGIIVDLARPNSECNGGLKVALTEIQNGDCKAKLPRQILNAQIECAKKQNWFSRLVQAPFTLVGTTVGIAGRTLGGAVVNVSNAAEAVTNGVGVGTGELFQFGKAPCTCCDSGVTNFGAAYRSYKDAVVALVEAPVDVVRTGLSGTAGVLQNATGELGYLLNPDGKAISAININEKVSFAFGVNQSTPAAAAPCCPSPCAAPCCPSPCAAPCEPACPCPSTANPCD